MAALGVHTADAGHPLLVVAAGEEAGRHAGSRRKLPIVVCREPSEVIPKHVLESVDCSLDIACLAWGSRNGNSTAPKPKGRELESTRHLWCTICGGRHRR